MSAENTIPSEPLESLLELAAAQLEQPAVDGLVYIHPVYGGPAEYVLLTAARFRRILQPYLGDEPLPDTEFAHGHAEPGMREDMHGGAPA